MFILYETTNLINGKKYRGVSNGQNEFYLGSGKTLKKAIKKYGWKNFSRQILLEASSREVIYQLEKEYVNQEWVDDRNTYNIKLGGSGGWDYINENGLKGPPHNSAKNRDNTYLLGKNNPMNLPGVREKHQRAVAYTSKYIRKNDYQKGVSQPGKLNGMFGVKREKAPCPNCGKEVDVANMSRWHGDKCKMALPQGFGPRPVSSHKDGTT